MMLRLRTFSLYICMLLVAVSGSLAGCSTMGGSDAGSDPANAGRDYYFSEFADVPIPMGMDSEKERFITYTQDGVRVGIEEFSGRIDMTSLVNTMKNYLGREGWTLRSVFRAKRSIMIFEKADRICSLYVTDGTFTTTMLVFVSPKLADGVITYTPPASSTAAPVSSGTGGAVQSYPAGGFSSRSEQPLSQ